MDCESEGVWQNNKPLRGIRPLEIVCKPGAIYNIQGKLSNEQLEWAADNLTLKSEVFTAVWLPASSGSRGLGRARLAQGADQMSERYNLSMEIDEIIGDYSEFFAVLLRNLNDVGMDAGGWPLGHFCYRVTTHAEYATKREQLKSFSRAFVENEFNGRPVSMLLLRKPLQFTEVHSVDLIELPAPREAHTYPRGLEHVGFVVGPGLAQFQERNRAALSGQKDRGRHGQVPFITFSNGKTAKFYERSLLAIVIDDGWQFSPISGPDCPIAAEMCIKSGPATPCISRPRPYTG